ncbi:MAG: membrane protein insertase YidC [Actinomycetia bacterium]|nr:membrane protein insertase YidC [Actinomycetes bacterium]
MLKVFEDLLLEILNFFYSYVGNYGVAIVLLTIVVRLILLPLTIKQTKSMLAMQKFQPKIKELQEKYKKDKEKLQKETMKLYSENKINPLGGCLPLILQIPIFWALFRMLLNNKDLAQASFLGISDLSRMPGYYAFSQLSTNFVEVLPYYFLVIIMMLTTYIPQKMMPTDSQQAKTMNFMVIFMVVIAWRLPAGILIYWITTNMWQIAQQFIQLRLEKKEE